MASLAAGCCILSQTASAPRAGCCGVLPGAVGAGVGAGVGVGVGAGEDADMQMLMRVWMRLPLL